ncbi:transcriptional regulator, SarA/Rot family [Staphylococcus rostri]|uniref:Regulator n=1 Tax=Staphylococcus rostri TaxID=522262 RepID=A0A2K3YVZ2_9STAP|nr:winged helix DNA-binding protein [Staphylococcus rostri]MDO5374876.1 winged helix DNA-binding protein [Staphylococcus rostri]PNZ29771.1 regulator [Staphylococcus rostri]
MKNGYTMDSEQIFFYESYRKKIISEIKKQYGLKLNDILFLYHLKSADSQRISLHKVKQSIDFSLMEVHKSLTALTEMGIIGKERSTEDERKVYITFTDEQYSKMDEILKNFDQIQKSILSESK